MSLSLENVSIKFKQGHEILHVIENLSMKIAANESVGLVGESGSGKSVTALSIMQLLPDSASISGSIYWKEQNLLEATTEQLETVRGKEIGLIFQNPLASLNPVFSIGSQMIETIRYHHKVSKKEATERAIDLLHKVRIPDAKNRLFDYPHQFSLGMCQRVMIALTLSMQPSLLIADEPTASLDVTVQAQILELLNDLKHEYDMSILLISHDLGVIAQNCTQIVVMYLGTIVETGNPDNIFTHPQHPYTQALIAAIPSIHHRTSPRVHLKSAEPPSLYQLPKGCRFHPRCPYATDRCRIENPSLTPTQSNSSVACFYPLN